MEEFGEEVTRLFGSWGWCARWCAGWLAWLGLSFTVFRPGCFNERLEVAVETCPDGVAMGWVENAEWFAC